jgi:hypothetical protein
MANLVRPLTYIIQPFQVFNAHVITTKTLLILMLSHNGNPCFHTKDIKDILVKSERTIKSILIQNAKKN